MRKRKVLSKSHLKEMTLPRGAELLGRVIKLLGSDHVLVKCTYGKTRMGRMQGNSKEKSG